MYVCLFGEFYLFDVLLFNKTGLGFAIEYQFVCKNHRAQCPPYTALTLPQTTISGTTSCISKAQKCDPTRPKPVCTSSAMHTPPAARTCAYTCFRYPGGWKICPAQLAIDSAMNAAGWP